MNIAVIGSGISGLGAALMLQREHDVTLFEKSDKPGGHTMTFDVEQKGKTYAVDTGFVVYNETTYPNFVRLLDLLNIASQPTSMSFGIKCESSGIEYCGTSLNTIFAQRRNLFRVEFYRLLLDIRKFNERAQHAAREGVADISLGEFLEQLQPSPLLLKLYLIPLVSAIWSTDPKKVAEFPAEFFLRFCARHRLLQVQNQLPWRVVRGGSCEYVRALVQRLRNEVRTSTRIASVHRQEDQVEVRQENGAALYFDHLVIATHSDQALRMLADATDAERDILGSIKYQQNDAVLHTDTTILPRSRRAWANWNYLLTHKTEGRALTTYDMSGLQGLDTETPFLLTLNDEGRIDPSLVHKRIRFSHPLYDTRVIEAQNKWNLISGIQRTHYCGAYWGCGFHEDGLKSALNVCKAFGLEL